MIIPRWKMMAGVLGVSLGGLAAIAGQCPKPGDAKTRRADDPPMTAELPKVPSGGSAPAAKPVLPTVDVLPPAVDLPALPVPTGSAKVLPPPAKPETLPDLPAIPATASKPVAGNPEVVPASGSTLPALPVSGPATLPAPAVDLPKPSTPTAPTAPMSDPFKANPSAPAPAADLPPPLPGKPTPTPSTPPSAPPSASSPPPALVVPGDTDPLLGSPAAKPPTVAPAAATAVVANKFKIILRVGEGEPMFEVRHGDDLVMKVTCEKVDIKSPEKGQGLSAVTATGKVRFVGFGAEGTCDSFAFLAGTGEVAMQGNVKVQVKDKIGRVESELTTEQMKYKLDSTAMPGVLKP